MAKAFFSKEQQELIVSAIREAEKNTSGEIQVHIEESCKGEVLDRAAVIFAKLKMHLTKERNGVLFYLAVKDHKFAILGDSGIHNVVPDNFWEYIKEIMQERFRNGQFTEGLCEGIRKAGMQLQVHFPYKRDDKNELPDEISFGKEKH
jgi:uncharacterized membrane protein